MTLIHILLLLSYIHPLHLTVCNVDISDNGKNNSLAVRVFIDDFEIAVYRKTGKQLWLTKDTTLLNVQKYASDYIFSKIKLYGKDDIILENYKFTEYKIEDLAVWWFFEFDLLGKPKNIRIVNALMTGMFMDQKNMTFVKYRGNETAKLFDYKNREAIFELHD